MPRAKVCPWGAMETALPPRNVHVGPRAGLSTVLISPSQPKVSSATKKEECELQGLSDPSSVISVTSDDHSTILVVFLQKKKKKKMHFLNVL